MILDLKICGISDPKTLKFIINHKYSVKFIGFIVNYPKSKRYVEFDKLRLLTSIDNKNSKFVAVLVKPDDEILEKIKNLNFDYYQIYDSSPDQIKFIKDKYKKKIIVAITVNNKNDVNEYKNFEDVADIYLFDSKGYEQSFSFDHELLKNLKFKKEVMIAGNIQINDKLDNFKEIADIIDISGGLETSGLKDISKIEIFLKKLKLINDET